MREHLVRVVGPALVAVVEFEAPSRVFAIQDSAAEVDALEAMLRSRPRLAEAFGLLLGDGLGESARRRAWSKVLAEQEGGVTELVVSLLAELAARPKETP